MRETSAQRGSSSPLRRKRNLCAKSPSYHGGYCTPHVYTTLYIPGYTTPTPHPATVASRHARCYGPAAVERAVVELTVSGRRVTVVPSVTASTLRHPFHCWARSVQPMGPEPRDVDNCEHLGEECCLLSHHPFHCWTCLLPSSVTHPWAHSRLIRPFSTFLTFPGFFRKVEKCPLFPVPVIHGLLPVLKAFPVYLWTIIDILEKHPFLHFPSNSALNQGVKGGF